MTRIEPVTAGNTPEESRPILEQIGEKFGRAPNVFATLAHSSAALKALMAMSGALGDGVLSAAQQEAIALRMAEVNCCHYCLAAHWLKAKMAGADEQEAFGWRRGEADDPKVRAMLNLVTAMSHNDAARIDAAFDGAREAELTDEEILEVVAQFALNVFTNNINHLAETEVDFPEAPPLQ